MYFEQIVLPVLRRAGILNVNLFIDGSMLDEQLPRNKAGFVSNRGAYSITPVNLKGAFHPKMIVAFGAKKGFAGIGSGNLTSSGMSGNQEIWAASSFDDGDENPIWQHIKSFLGQLGEFTSRSNSIKLKWIQENSVWYQNLEPRIDQWYHGKNGKEKYRVITTVGDRSVGDVLVQLLPKNPQSFHAVAPYYDVQGKFISDIVKELSPDIVHCVVDSENGTLPTEIQVEPSIEFSDWKTISSSDSNNSVRLHAKAFQWTYAKETYFLLGSNNASFAAMGGPGINSINSEAALLVHSSSSRDFFAELGVTFPDKGTLILTEYHPTEDLLVDETAGFLEKIIKRVHAEFEYGILRVESDSTDVSEIVSLVVYDADGHVVFQKDDLAYSHRLELNLDKAFGQRAFSVAFVNGEERISPYALIHHLEVLKKSNPDHRLAAFNALLNQVDFSDRTLMEILQKFDFTPKVNYDAVRGVRGESTGIMAKTEVPRLSETEFNRNESVESSSSSAATRFTLFEQFLNSWLSGEVKTEAVEDSSEITAGLTIDAGTNEIESVTDNKSSYILTTTEGETLRKVIENALGKIGKAISHWGEIYLERVFSGKPVEIKQDKELIQSALIGSHLVLSQFHKTFSEQRHSLTIEFDKYTQVKFTTDEGVSTISGLELLELIEKEFGLDRTDVPTGALKNQVFYSLDVKNAERLKEWLNNQSGFVERLIRSKKKAVPIKEVSGGLIKKWLFVLDETASFDIEHRIISSRMLKVEHKMKGLSSFFVDAIAQVILTVPALTSTESDDDKELVQIRHRLLMNILLMLCYFQVDKKSAKYIDLVLLNALYKLGSSDLKYLDVKQELEKINSNIAKGEGLDSVKLKWIEERLGRLKNWNNLREDGSADASKLHLSKLTVGNILFHEQLGYFILSKVDSNYKIDGISPLGRWQIDNTMGFKGEFLGVRFSTFQ